MTVSAAGKAGIISSLQVALQKGTRLRLILLLRGDAAGSAQVQQRNRELQRAIDQLLDAAMQEWAGSAPPILADLRTANRALQDSIRDVRNKVRTAERVTKAVGVLDAVIGQAGRLLGR